VSSGIILLKARAALFITSPSRFAPRVNKLACVFLSFHRGRTHEVQQRLQRPEIFASTRSGGEGGGRGPWGQISLAVWYWPFLHAAWFTRADSILICMHTRANNGPAQRVREMERSCYSVDGVALRADRLLLLFSWIARSENKQNARWCGSCGDSTYTPDFASAFLRISPHFSRHCCILECK